MKCFNCAANFSQIDFFSSWEKNVNMIKYLHTEECQIIASWTIGIVALFPRTLQAAITTPIVGFQRKTEHFKTNLQINN